MHVVTADPMAPTDLMPRCTARARSGQRCKQPPIPGGTVCYWHGGAAPRVRAAAADRLVEREYRRIVGAPPMTDAYSALEDLGGRAMALVERLSAVVDALDEVRYQGGTGGRWEQVRGELPLLLASLKQAESIAGRIIGLGIAERRLQLDEARAALVVAAVEVVLARLGLDAAQQERGRALLHAELVSGGAR